MSALPPPVSFALQCYCELNCSAKFFSPSGQSSWRFHAIVCVCGCCFGCSVDNLKAFVQKLLDDELTPYMKSEPVPESQGPVKVCMRVFVYGGGGGPFALHIGNSVRG